MWVNALGNVRLCVFGKQYSKQLKKEQVRLGNGLVRPYDSEKFGEDLKRHAFYHFDMLSKTSNDYIDSLLKMDLFD